MKALIALGALILALLALVLLWEPLFGREATAPGEAVDHTEEPAEPPPVLRGRAESPDETERTTSQRPASAPDESATALEGRVVTAEGTAVPGVPVLVLNSWVPPVEVAQVPTDAEGRFRVEDLTPGRLQLLVAGGGWVTERGPGEGFRVPTLASVEVREGAVARILLRVVPAAAAFGRVTDDEGRPVPGAEVRAFTAPPSKEGLGALFAMLSQVRRMPLARTAADEHGAYRLHGLEDGEEYVLEASTPKHPPTRSAAFRARRASPRQVDLVVRAGRWIEVTVRTVEGRPIRGARVFGHEQKEVLVLTLRSSKEARTDAEGRARLGPFAHVPVVVSVNAYGFVSDRERDGPPRSVPVDQEKIEIRLDRGNTITGRLFDAEGRPVAGATVQAQRRTFHDGGYGITGFESTETAADGRFGIEGLPEGPITLWARTYEPPIRETTLLVESGSRDVRMAFGADSARGLELVILDPDGRPVPRVRVEYGVFAPREILDGRAHLQDVDDAGEPRFGVTSIRVFDARDREGTPLPLAETTVAWKAGDPRFLEVRLEPERILRGRVLGPDGSGLGGVEVVLKLLDGTEPRNVQTAADGSFEIRGLGSAVGSLEVGVTGDLIPPPSLEVVPSRDAVVVQVRAGVRPIVRVLDPRGDPVVGAVVSVSAPGESTLAEDLARAFGLGRRTLADGTLRLPVLDPAASLRLRVEPPDDHPELGGLVVEPWRPQDDELRLPAALTITGIVRDLAGRPVPRAAIDVAVSGQPPRATGADEKGAFVVGDLRAGIVRLRASLPVRWVTGETIHIGPAVEVQAGARDVVLEGRAGETLTVSLEDAPDTIDGFDVLLVPEDAEAPQCFHHGDRGGAGHLRFHGLKRGRIYTLWVPPTADAPDLCVLRTGVKASADILRVRRSAGRTVEGRLELPDGAWFTSVRAEWGRIQHEGVVKADGSFTIRGLPDLAWVVHAWAKANDGLYVGRDSAAWGTSMLIRMAKAAPEDDGSR